MISDCLLGEAIADRIFKEMKLRGVDAAKIMGLGLDGASVMTGNAGGVTGIMKRQNPHLVNIHCVAHRFALCTSQAATGITMFDDYQRYLSDLFYYFKNSAARVSNLKAIQNILEMPQLKVKEVHGVRWLSFFNALHTVFKMLEPLIIYLGNQPKQKDPKAAGLREKV